MKRIAGKHFNEQKTRLLMEESYPNSKMEVPDPWYGAEPGYHEVFELIDKACSAIINRYAVKELSNEK
jgi:protein-tyrosine phosphatase